MKILIIEGIATSGKSSLIETLTEIIGNSQVRVYDESKTHEPIMDKPGEFHIEFFKSLLRDAAKSNSELVIFDRFHFTQAFRAKANICQYLEIEDLLAEQKTLVAYLQVDESAIADKVKLAAGHRESEWGDYVKTKGKSFDDIAMYYSDQQRNQMELLKQSKLESRIFNTTDQAYPPIANEIINDWLN